ncbi:AGAP011670-PA-like protein [Anopheles sinensis]|uniref:AGAP011670-PA-like protein n=1 Tax=Anopheles sinensis TaxID=74873 RepID=A0A084VID8_ANOSI|nr:AGAP011670-PA-like protein [Anopheles sinensis]
MANIRDNTTKKSARPSINVAIHPNCVTPPGSIGNTFDGEHKSIFFDEISQIMRGYGDCEKPLRESVILVEKIVLQQLRGIMQEAIDHAMSRPNSPTLSRRDFEYIMRKNQIRVARLQKYFRDMAMVKKRLKDICGGRYSHLNLGGSSEASDDDSDREVPEKYDEEKVRRLFRADRIAQILTGKQYDEYNLARRTSFMHRNAETFKGRMRAWLNIPEDVNITQSCLLTLAYLAHETIAVLVDFCILTRLDSGNRSVDPYSRVTSSGKSYNMLHACPEVTQGRGMDGVRAITPQEINEAMRRHRQMATRTSGRYRNALNFKPPYLAM